VLWIVEYLPSSQVRMMMVSCRSSTGIPSVTMNGDNGCGWSGHDPPSVHIAFHRSSTG